MWNSIDEWFDAIEQVTPRMDSDEIFNKTKVACHAGARIYNIDIRRLIQNLETDSTTFRIPLTRIRVSKELITESLHSAADLFHNKYEKSGERELYAIYSFASPTLIDNNICNAYVSFVLWGNNVNTPVASNIPRINALADFGRYLQKNNIKAHIYSTADNGFWTTK